MNIENSSKENHSDIEDEEIDDDEDDPIVKRIPIFFNSTPDFSLPSFAHFKPVLEENIDENNNNTQKDTSSITTKKKQRPSSLTLLQYPFKTKNTNTLHGLLPPSLRPELNTNLIEKEQQQENIKKSQIYAKYKIGVRSLKLDLPLETKIGIIKNRFSDERAREFAKGLNFKSKNLSCLNNNNIHQSKFSFNDEVCDPLDRITLASTLVPEQANYAIGIFRQRKKKQQEIEENEKVEEDEMDELHIVPLDQTLQMRPQLEYLDNLDILNSQADKTVRREQGLESDSSSNNNSDEEENEEIKKKKLLAKKKTELLDSKSIQVSILNNNNSSINEGDRQGAGLRSGGPLFAPLRAAEAETPVNLIHYHAETKESEAIRQKMFCSSKTKLVSISSWTELLKV